MAIENHASIEFELDCGLNFTSALLIIIPDIFFAAL